MCLHQLSIVCPFNINSDFMLIIANHIPFLFYIKLQIIFKVISLLFDLDIILKIAVNALKLAFTTPLSFTTHFKFDFLSDRMPDHVDICSIGSL